MNMRAKFRCESVTFHGDILNAATPREYTLRAVYDASTEENRRFARYTPMGELKMRIDNPVVSLEVGEEYYLDFTPTVLARAERTPETMGNVHAPADTPAGRYEAGVRTVGGKHAAHGGYPDAVPAPDLATSPGLVIPDAEPEKIDHSASER